MSKTIVSRLTRVVALCACLLLLTGAPSSAQKGERETIQAVAMGQGTQLGKIFNVKIIIEEASTPEDQRILVEAFTSHGMKGLINTLSKMSAKGRISMPATLGYDISYIRVIPTEGGGRRIRMVTNRPIAIGEVWTDTRSMDYSLSALELDLPAGKGDGEGTLFPACQFEIKDSQLTIEALQNPWKLTNVSVH
jgi:hypothetical protein